MIRKLCALFLTVLTLGGCMSTLGVDADRLDTANKQLADKVLFVETLANFATRLTAQRVISPENGRQVASSLQEALNALNTTQASIARNGDPSQTTDTIDRVDRLLAVALDLLVAFAPTETRSIERQYRGLLNVLS